MSSSSKNCPTPDGERQAIRDEIKRLGDEIRTLKEQKGDATLIKEKVARMLAKKAELGDDGAGKFVLKCAKGTRDYGPSQMAIRERVLHTVISAFKRHGAETIDTPVFELRDVLMGKYGDEGGKLVYDLVDQGGEQLSLRYDLTDFDIAGVYDPLIPDAECLKLVDEVLGALALGEFETKLNHRLLLEGMFSVCGVSQADFKTVCSSIDKLDKVEWDAVRKELMEEKQVEGKVVDALEQFVRIRELNPSISNDDVLKRLRGDSRIAGNATAMRGLDEMETLLKYCRLYGIEPRVAFDPSLARGLDYYTGAIFETVVKDFTRHSMPKSPSAELVKTLSDVTVDGEEEESGPVGSVAAGGRYDRLVGVFLAKKGMDVPCVGVSFGIERLFSIIELKAKMDSEKIRTTETEVFVASAQKGLLEERMKLCRILWDANVKTEMSYKANPKLLTQLQYCEERAIPIALVLGESEIAAGVVKLRDVKTRAEMDVPLSDVVDSIRRKLEQL